jgi:putative membrane protein
MPLFVVSTKNNRMDIIIPYLHILSVMTLMGALITEHLVLKPGIGKPQIIQLAQIDLIYTLSVVVALATGLLRWFVYGKGNVFYLSNPVFHTKLTLFIILGLLSVFPTVRFIKWRKQVRSGDVPVITDKSVNKLLIYIRLELLIVALIPLLAVMTARGLRF